MPCTMGLSLPDLSQRAPARISDIFRTYAEAGALVTPGLILSLILRTVEQPDTELWLVIKSRPLPHPQITFPKC